MKDQLKDSFRDALIQKAPEGFTDKLMQDIAQAKTKRSAFVPRFFLWFFISSFIMLISFVIWSQAENVRFTLPYQQFTALVQEFVPGLSILFCVGTLMLLKEVFHYQKIA